MARRKKKTFNAGVAVILAVLCLAVGAAGGYIGYLEMTTPVETEVYTSGDLSVHFLELGNKYTGDCTYIKAGDTDILIDAGSRVDSIATISAYIDQFVTDGKLEYVIVTHAHQDHYAGFATNDGTDSLFDIYECGTIIDFALTNQKSDAKMYNNYLRERSEEINNGATHYTAAQCIETGKKQFELSATATLTILDQKFYYEKAETENDYSVCALISDGGNNFLFTGDLEEEGEQSLVEKNNLPRVDVYKAGHHGSKTSSHEPLLAEIQPEIICVCCCAGSSEYGAKPENTFPTQAFVDRVSKYTDRVYVTTLCVDYDNGQFTSMNGNIVVSYSFGELVVNCSASDTKLKDTEWFKNNRTCPESWK